LGGGSANRRTRREKSHVFRGQKVGKTLRGTQKNETKKVKGGRAISQRTQVESETKNEEEERDAKGIGRSGHHPWVGGPEFCLNIKKRQGGGGN